MTEADTPNLGDFVEPIDAILSQPQANCPFYSVSNSENTIIERPDTLSLLTPTQNEESETEVTSDTTQPDWVAEPDREKQAAVNSEFQQLLALNEELRSANNSLYEKVEELTGFLSESEKALHMQTKRLSVTESMLNQQNQEITAAQHQIQSLFEQLETARQTAQRQEIQIESYKAQLEINQQRLAQLERECAALQSNYNEQSHHLLQSENACRDLRTRLMRQQRQTLQFKAALEKCLDTPFPCDAQDETADPDFSSTQPKYSKQAKSFTPNAQPIRPWSSELESFTDDVDDRESEISAFSLHQHDNHPPLPFTQDLDTTSTQTPTQPTATPEVTPVEASNLEQQLDSVIQMFFVATPASEPPQIDVAQATETWDYAPIPADDEAQTATINLTSENSEDKDLWSEPQSLPLELSETSEYATNVNSPSPLIYPQRPSKGRKSLAAVELPNFRPNK